VVFTRLGHRVSGFLLDWVIGLVVFTKLGHRASGSETFITIKLDLYFIYLKVISKFWLNLKLET
jgi:hypothetical protein